jgi:diguanylate cyclase (GGDEF)-like protein
MHGNKISCVVVAENGSPIGVITERDIVRVFFETLGIKDSPLQVAKDVMSTPAFTIPRQTSVSEAMAVACAKQHRHVIVIDDEDQLLGIATQTDLLRNHHRQLERRSESLALKTRTLMDMHKKSESMSFEDRDLSIGNRRAMEVVLAHTHRQSKRNQQDYSVVMTCIDHLAGFRMRHGDRRANQLLEELLQQLTLRVRHSDQIYRYDDNIFLTLLLESTLPGALMVAERSKSLLSNIQLESGDDEMDQIEIQLGVASYEGSKENAPKDWLSVIMRAEYSLSRPSYFPDSPSL